jgi:molybdenum cofactor synthesis domain-containing protein
LSVNISREKGTIKLPVAKIFIDNMGVSGDAHAGNWHRQVSLLGVESVEKFSREASRRIAFGEFAENITTQGIELYHTRPLDRFVIGSAELEVTQIGKKCHGDNCAIFREVGNCVMPKEGIFCRVIREGEVVPGMELVYKPKVFDIRIITLSDRASKGEYEDRSGPKIKELVSDYMNSLGWKFSIINEIIPDDKEMLSARLAKIRDEKADFIFTSGGTGIGPRDITPDVARRFFDKEIPGIMDMIRLKYGADMPAALTSRAVAGVMGQTLVFTLPGSVKAVTEYMAEITRHLRHLVNMLHGIDEH